MKIARFCHGETIAFGIVDEEEDELVVLKADPMFAGYEPTGERVPLAEAKLLAPGHPALEGRRRRQELPRARRRDGRRGAGRAAAVPEAEHLGRSAPATPSCCRRRASASSTRASSRSSSAASRRTSPKRMPRACIFGYTIANDVTARDLQQRDGQWTRAKGFDTFCPLGPVIDTELDLESGTIETQRERRAPPARAASPTWCTRSRRSSPTRRACSRCCPATSSSPARPPASARSSTATPSRSTVSGLGTLSNPVRARALSDGAGGEAPRRPAALSGRAPSRRGRRPRRRSRRGTRRVPARRVPTR